VTSINEYINCNKLQTALSTDKWRASKLLINFLLCTTALHCAWYLFDRHSFLASATSFVSIWQALLLCFGNKLCSSSMLNRVTFDQLQRSSGIHRTTEPQGSVRMVLSLLAPRASVSALGCDCQGWLGDHPLFPDHCLSPCQQAND
jgi:hypothetical protein